MGETQDQVIEYQNRLKELVRRDYIYLFIGLIVVGMAFGFLYTQLNPGKAISFDTLLGSEKIVNKKTLEQTGNIAGIIEERQINFITPTPGATQGGLTNPSSESTLSRPEENGQISAIATERVTSTATRYTVKEGDNLAYIAGIMYGDREAWQIIAKANDLKNPNALVAGMVLVIPR